MSQNKSSTTIQTPLAKARGIGSAHGGTHHKLLHSITTLLNIPFFAWMVYTVYSLRNADYDAFIAWFQMPLNAFVTIAFLIVAFKHFALELQVVYEDYISCKALRMIKVIGMKLVFLGLTLTCIISILKILFSAGA